MAKKYVIAVSVLAVCIVLILTAGIISRRGSLPDEIVKSPVQVQTDSVYKSVLKTSLEQHDERRESKEDFDPAELTPAEKEKINKKIEEMNRGLKKIPTVEEQERLKKEGMVVY